MGEKSFFRGLTLFVVSLSFAYSLSIQANPPAITAQDLDTKINDSIDKVLEFRELRAEAKRLGIKLYLFGGTAASMAHYSKWDLQREKGDARYKSDRFDYSFQRIFRSNQDVDLVISGTEEQAKKLESFIASRFKGIEHVHRTWEVRFLDRPRGTKDTLLQNPDFENQHTDSNSTGLIDLTANPPVEPLIQDLKEWNAQTQNRVPRFLNDVANGEITYHFSKSHDATARARSGMNPPILSVIRYLTKVFQFELKIRPEDEAIIKQIVGDFDPRSIQQGTYVANWIERNGKKLIHNAVNIEYAITKMDELGLRNKLRSIPKAPDHIDSLSWWMDKEPLRTKPVGLGTGRTARELGISRIAHDTLTPQIVESIARAHTGDANLLISRPNKAGEAAVHGAGLYTLQGNTGALGGGNTVVFELDPNARENHDFILPNGNIVLVLNKAAIRVDHCKLNYSQLANPPNFTGKQGPRNPPIGVRLLRKKSFPYVVSIGGGMVFFLIARPDKWGKSGANQVPEQLENDSADYYTNQNYSRTKDSSSEASNDAFNAAVAKLEPVAKSAYDWAQTSLENGGMGMRPKNALGFAESLDSVGPKQLYLDEFKNAFQHSIDPYGLGLDPDIAAEAARRFAEKKVKDSGFKKDVFDEKKKDGVEHLTDPMGMNLDPELAKEAARRFAEKKATEKPAEPPMPK